MLDCENRENASSFNRPSASTFILIRVNCFYSSSEGGGEISICTVMHSLSMALLILAEQLDSR